MTPLSDAEKVDIRRFCGYPAHGTTPSGMQSWRYLEVFGLLEFRLANLSDAEIAIVRRYLGTLTTLELAVPGASDHLDTDQASIWVRNKNEPIDRLHLLDEWRRRFAAFLGVKPGPVLSGGSLSLIV